MKHRDRRRQPHPIIKRARARRRLVERLEPRLQQHLFEDRSRDAATALADLRNGLPQLDTPGTRKA
jgi:hypothetical protein